MSEKIRIIHEGKFLQFLNRNGWEYVRRHNCSGIVIVVALTPKDEVIFVEQFRPPLNREVVEFPAGLVNDVHEKRKKRESILSAAKRELLEETGYKAKKAQVLLIGPVSAGSSADLVHMVRAWDLKKVSAGGGDETESIKVHAVPLREAEQWLKKKEKRGVFIEPKIYTGLYFLSKYNK